MKLSIFLCVCCVSMSAGDLRAQVIQQPVVQQFQVDSAVWVPDRGTARLGGVTSASSARNSFGPMRTGTSFGSSISGAYAESSVWIHDFETMDRALLSRQPSRAEAILQATSNPVTPSQRKLLEYRQTRQTKVSAPEPSLRSAAEIIARHRRN